MLIVDDKIWQPCYYKAVKGEALIGPFLYEKISCKTLQQIALLSMALKTTNFLL